MFRITPGQLASISESRRSDFTAKSVLYLKEAEPAWARDRSDQGIEAFIKGVNAFGEARSIGGAEALRTLMHLRIKHRFPDTVDGYAEMQLTAPGTSELVRVADFADTLEQGAPLKRISLDDPV